MLIIHSKKKAVFNNLSLHSLNAIYQSFTQQKATSRLPHYSTESEHGHVHGDEDYGDQKADEHDQRGFEQRAHAADSVFEFVGEGVALAAEHLCKAVGLLADTDQGRKFAVVQRGEARHARREKFAVLQAAADRGKRLPVGIEADYVGEHPHAREQRNPGRAEQVEQFTKLRLVVFADNRARNGQAQHEFRSPSLYLLSVSVGV